MNSGAFGYLSQNTTYMKTLILSILTIICGIWQSVNAQDMRHSTVQFSITCPTHNDLDKESALVTYNPTSHVLRLTTDIFEITDNKPAMDSTFSEEVNGMPLSLTVKIDIPEIEFKSSKNNGEEYVFQTLIECNGIQQTLPVTYIFIFAPVVGQQTTAVNFRLGFVIGIKASDFGLSLHKDCSDIIMKVQDAWLNRTVQ